MEIIKVKEYAKLSPFQKISILAFAEPSFYLRKNETPMSTFVDTQEDDYFLKL